MAGLGKSCRYKAGFARTVQPPIPLILHPCFFAHFAHLPSPVQLTLVDDTLSFVNTLASTAKGWKLAPTPIFYTSLQIQHDFNEADGKSTYYPQVNIKGLTADPAPLPYGGEVSMMAVGGAHLLRSAGES